MTGSGWRVEVRRGPVAAGHAPVGPFHQRTVVRHEPTRPAVVLGSGQDSPDGLTERATAAGLDVVRRRSCGGAVVVRPDCMMWVDVLLPRDDLWWDDDVGRSSRWLGEAWKVALVAAGSGIGTKDDQAEFRVADEGSCGATGLAVCFAAATAGEVMVGRRKVVGISQRRDRFGARFQCAVLVGADAVETTVVPLVGLLGLRPEIESVDEVRGRVGSVEATTDDLFAALLGVLDGLDA